MIGIIIITIISMLFGILLVSLDTAMPQDAETIEKLLPGYNCGACGYGGCKNLANAILQNKELYKNCKFLRGQALIDMQTYLEK